MIFLDINDWQLTSRDEHGQITAVDTAAVSSVSGKLSFGAQALKHSRSHPQRFNNKYLYTLAADPIAGDLSPAKNCADLLYHHLCHLSGQAHETYVLGISGHLTNQQLSLLLGICQEANMAVQGFVDLGLAIALGVPANADFHVLDIELHRMTISQIHVDGQQRSQQQSTAIDGIGASNITEGWMNVAADEFVQKTRFDPLHAGQSEQQLFEQIWGWLGTSHLRDHRVTVNNGEASRDIEVSRTLLLEKLAQRLDSFDFDQVQHLVISPRVEAIPGLHELLKARIPNIGVVTDEDITHGYKVLAEQLDANNIRRVTSVTVSSDLPAAVQSSTPSSSGRPAPTHLLNDHIAYDLMNERFLAHIDSKSRATITAQVSVNGIAKLGTKVGMGDNVSLNGSDYVAIRIE